MHPRIHVRAFGIALIALVIFISTSGHSSTENDVVIADSRRPVSTYSIVARDAKTGQMGVAVQSHWFSVGSIVTWAEAGVGAVATQSFVDPAYGPHGLELMRQGKSAKDALAQLVGADSGEAVRQVAFVDAKGRVAVHTGSKCIESAGHKAGKGYSVQANMMRNDKVVPAMAKAYESTKGDLADRMLAALAAAEKAGGDIRGRQSAAMLIVKPKSSGKPWADRVVDLRVEDHPHPVQELARLLKLKRAYDHMNEGDVAIEKGDMKSALRHYRAASKLAPESLEMQYWHAIALATNGRVQQSLPMFKKIFFRDKSWIDLTQRLTKPGILSDTLVRKILESAK